MRNIFKRSFGRSLTVDVVRPEQLEGEVRLALDGDLGQVQADVEGDRVADVKLGVVVPSRLAGNVLHGEDGVLQLVHATRGVLQHKAKKENQMLGLICYSNLTVRALFLYLGRMRIFVSLPAFSQFLEP